MSKVDFTPKGVCSRHISFDLEDGKVYNLKFEGGCDGNLKAIGRLVEGQDAAHVAEILNGNICGFKNTSCADQLAKAIQQALN
ncbi:MAG: TIGR03905 family TSCPD domain-containing protein [Lachnospiraceae bacterium]|nr:TIGR03905 family TSCPD domain-containing protein [Lachnospiraceae bacterium]